MAALNLFEYLRLHADLANAVAAIFSSTTALIAVVISVLTLRVQRHHNRISVRPVPEVTVADYEDSLRVKLRNNGVGPLFIRRVRVARGSTVRDSIIDLMPDLSSRPWTHFSHTLSGRTIQVDGVITLLELTQNEGENGFPRLRDTIRAALSGLTVYVEFTDTYGTTFPVYEKPLVWFARNLAA